MLQSFRGTFDSVGIRTLRFETDDERSGTLGSGLVEFWAVVDAEYVRQIRLALALGDRIGATRLLADTAASIGSILPS